MRFNYNTNTVPVSLGIQNTLLLNNFRPPNLSTRQSSAGGASCFIHISSVIKNAFAASCIQTPYVNFTPMCGEISFMPPFPSQRILGRWLVRVRACRLPVNRWSTSSY